ncbi:MAG: helix-turn-helix domain-containing protein, partial [Synergistaceae bacterium]
MADELNKDVNADIKKGAFELGAKLRTLREAQNITIQDVSQHTKIQKHYISAIEDGNLELLPKGPYTRSFVKQYCLYLEAADLWPFYDELTKVQKITVPKHEVKDESGYTSAEPTVFKPKSYFWVYLVIAL